MEHTKIKQIQLGIDLIGDGLSSGMIADQGKEWDAVQECLWILDDLITCREAANKE